MSIYPDDPRSYLRREYEQRHQRNPRYSWRSFARDLKVSPSMLSEFLKGRYGFSKGKAVSVAQSLRLDSNHTEHFVDLLEAGFHRLSTQRDNARLRAEERLRRSSTSIPDVNLRELMDWSFFAALEIVGIERGEFIQNHWLEPFRRLHARAESALIKLRNLNLIGTEGFPSEDITVAGEQFNEEDLRQLHTQTLELAKGAIEGLSSAERENLSVFASVRKEDFAEMRKELNDTVLQVLNKYASRPHADTVLTFALQMFPIYSKHR